MPILSWGLLAAASAIGALSALYVALAPAGDQTPLVGRSWIEFAAADPEMASIVSRLLVVLGLLGVGFGTLALVVVLGPYRRAQRWAWYVLWLVPVVYAAIAVRQIVRRLSHRLLVWRPGCRWYGGAPHRHTHIAEQSAARSARIGESALRSAGERRRVMGNRAVVERFTEALAANDFDVQDALLHDDYVGRYPQSGEIIRGRENRRKIMENYPGTEGGITASSDRIVGADDEFVTGPSWNMIHVSGIRRRPVTDRQDYVPERGDLAHHALPDHAGRKDLARSRVLWPTLRPTRLAGAICGARGARRLGSRVGYRTRAYARAYSGDGLSTSLVAAGNG